MIWVETVYCAVDPSRSVINEAQGYCSPGVCGAGAAQGRTFATAFASDVGLLVEQPATQILAASIAKLKMCRVCFMASVMD
jgi:hypothetical protein